MVQFFFVGPPKTGTTWIYEILCSVSEICLSRQTKELEFFNKHFDRGISWYHHSFEYSGKKYCDISTSYFTSELARKRIKEYNQNAKIIITIRNPVSRLISHYKHNLRFGIINKIPIQEAITRHPGMIENSLYSKYIKEWIKDFGRENVMILPLELLNLDPNRYLYLLEGYLDISINRNEHQFTEKVNYASQPKSYFLAKWVRIIRKELNNRGLHFMVKSLKKLGLKRLIYEGGKNIKIEEQDQEEIKQFFRSDLFELREFDIPKEIIAGYK